MTNVTRLATLLAAAILCGCPSEGDDDSALMGDDDATAADDDDTTEPLVWPNADSGSNSDPWLAEHHAEIRQMRPRILALNFVNARSMEAMDEAFEAMVEVIAEASRYHGYADEAAPVFLQPELAYSVDLRDAEPPEDWPYRNSTLYPREDPVEGYWGFDYERLFDDEFAALYGVEDPDAPGELLDLCELHDRGLVHEVWIYGDADVPDVSAAEILELKPYYDEDRQRLPEMNRCAGNGCFDAEDTIPDACTRTVRIAWYNNTRGPGCFLESLSHGFESAGAWNPDQIPTLQRDFVRFAAYELDDRFGLPFDSFYACGLADCFSYPTETSVDYDTGTHTGSIDPWDAVCGNAHFTPNGRAHYDLSSGFTVQSSCETFGLGDELRAYTSDAFAPYQSLASDCMGPHLVWWRQNFPGLDTAAVDEQGRAILNWWPYVYY